MALTPEQLAALTNAEAVAWLIAESPIDLQGFGQNFPRNVGNLLDAVRDAVRAATVQAARDAFEELRADLAKSERFDTLSDAIVLVDDAVLLGEDPKAAIVRERARLSGGQGIESAD